MDKVNFLSMLNKLVQSFLSVLPKILGALFIVLIGFIIARFIGKFLDRFLAKIGVNKISDLINNMELFGPGKMQFNLSGLIGKIFYYAILMMFFMMAADVLHIQAITDLLNDIIDYLPNLLTAMVILFFGIIIADVFRKGVKSALDSLGIPSANLISSFVFYFVLVNIALTALGQAKINTDFIAQNISIIIGGIVLAFAIGYGLASKNIAANILSSFYLKDQFRPGMYIDINGQRGEIIRMDKSSLLLRTDDGILMIPLSHLATEMVKILK